MFYRDATFNRWGWFTTAQAQPACSTGLPEQHDLLGHGTIDSTQVERHCLDNGEYTLTIDTVVWNGDGSAIVQRGTKWARRVAMLGTLGAFDTSSGSYHDVRVSLDRVPPQDLGLSGELRAGDAYILYTSDTLYPAGRSFTIAAGDTLWFQATYVGTGQSRQWYGIQKAILTQFNFDHRVHPLLYRGGVNSSPHTETSPALWSFGQGAEPFRVVGRVVAPHHLQMDSGIVRLGDSIIVTTVAPDACFAVSGPLWVDSLLAFDGRCSTGLGVLQYCWTFGDGSSVDWSSDSALVHHAYGASGSYSVTLRVRRAGSTAPVDSTTDAITISAPLWVRLLGYDYITASGTYTWTSVPHDGVPPYGSYRWYYQEEGSSEDSVGAKPTYRRYVPATKVYSFRLRTTVRDAVPTTAEDTLWVDVVPRGGRYADVGLVDAAGACELLPSEVRARQAAPSAMARTGRWPVPCLARAP